jgi:hypothetical protein
MLFVVSVMAWACVECAGGVVFDVQPNAQRCLQEQIRKGVPVSGEYSVSAEEQQPVPVPGRGSRLPRQFLVRFTDATRGTELYKSETAAGTFAFTPEHDGTLDMCFTDSTVGGGGGWRAKQHQPARSVALTMRQGVSAQAYADIAKKEQLFPLGVELRRLEDDVWTIREEMIYQRRREEELRDVNELVNTRAAWFAVFALGVLGASTAWQLVYLKRFFQKKKLI